MASANLKASIVKVLGDPGISPLDASDRLLQLRDENVALASLNIPPGDTKVQDTPGLEGFLWDLWTCVLDIVQESRDSQRRLIDVLRLLKTGPGGPYCLWRSDTVAWSNLPLLGAVVREEYDRATPSAPADLRVYPAQRERWINLNAFIAHLWADGVADFSIYGLWALREGLEGEDRHGMEDFLRVEVVTSWLAIAAEPMFLSRKVCGPRGNPDWPSNAGAPGRGGPLWKGVDGYAPERWAFWKKRLAEVKMDVDGVNTIVQAAEAALARMAEVESSDIQPTYEA